ncbi:MAG: histone deacetylase [Deltaproteobacteria bacterium]|nr:histone deacetylase [Deltaproteobacteria bacterium]
MSSASRPATYLFYRSEYVSTVLEAGARHTFDIGKPKRIHDALIAAGVARAGDFIAPSRLSDEQLRLVHTPDYIVKLHQPETLARLLFLDPEHPWDRHLLDPFLYAGGGTLAAAQMAFRKRTICANIGGGYHHAQADKAEGFCAIADVGIAIRSLQRERKVERVLIVDLDYHHGNGNAEIFAADEDVFTFSMHAGNWCWITKRNNLDVELPSHTGDVPYLAALEQHLPAIVRDFAPDFAFYIAGSDPFVEDTLGDFDLSEVGMLRRDQLVTDLLCAQRIPMVVVTAGGYGPSSWRIHFNYFRWLRSPETA